LAFRVIREIGLIPDKGILVIVTVTEKFIREEYKRTPWEHLRRD
jgi:hypothetical protein